MHIFLDPENLDASGIQQKLEYYNNTMELEAKRDYLERQMMYSYGHSKWKKVIKYYY